MYLNSYLLISNKFCNGGERPEQGEQAPAPAPSPPQYGLQMALHPPRDF
jgi:hypothetical protein